MSKPLRHACIAGLALLATTALTSASLTAPVMAATPEKAQQQAQQQALNSFAHGLGYRFTIVDNTAPEGFISEVRLTLPKVLPQAGWSLYIGMVNPVRSLDSDTFDLTHVNGDLYRLTPKAGVALKPGQTYVLTLHAEGHFFSQFHVMPNAYIAADGLKAAVIPAARSAIDPASGQEILPFVSPMTDAAKLQTADAGDAPKDLNVWKTPQHLFNETEARYVAGPAPEFVILPTPASVTRLPGAALDLTRGVHLTGTSDPAGIKAALADLQDAGIRVSPGGVPLDIAITGQGHPESYHLTAQNGKITVTATDAAGASYALESLAQQAAYEHNRLKPLDITDAPRFSFRGLHLDVARNFESKAHILQIIDQMERYKLNRLHLHLGDDEGWRLAITDLPELTDIGSKRCHDLAEDTCLLPQLGAGPDGVSSVNGYLTRADYVEILQAATAHHIEVMPSFDMPGHSRAATRSMEARYRRLAALGKTDEANEYRLEDPADTTVYDSIQHYNDNTLNICLPSTYHFIEKVVDTIASYHQAAGVPLTRYHIGADETAGAWTGSPACQALMKDQNLTPAKMTPYFIEKVSAILSSRNIEPAGWSDGMGHVDPAHMPKVVQSNSWGTLFGGGIAEAYNHANRGWDVVMSTPDVLYFDMPQASDPAERGYDWASRETGLFKVFAFMPENLAANGSVMKTWANTPGTMTDVEPLDAGRHITGMQGQLWSEGIRSDRIADYMLFPRTLALAERAWHAGAWEPAYSPGKSYSYGDGQVDSTKLYADWQAFNAKLKPQLAALDAASLTYRLPVPGARVTGGVLEANVSYGDLTIQYRSRGGKWTTYREPVAVTGVVELRTVSPNGKRGSRVVTVQ